MSMDIQAKLEELETTQVQGRDARERDRRRAIRAGWRATGYYSAYYATAGFLLGSIGAIASLLFNVIGSPARRQEPAGADPRLPDLPPGRQALQLDARARAPTPSATG